MKIIDRYIYNSLFLPSIFGISIFTFIMMLNVIMEVMERLFASDLPFISIIDYRIYKNMKFLGLVFVVLILATISVKFLGRDAKGAVRWIQIGRITLQPSEFVKVGMIVILAGFFSELEKRNKLKDPIWSVLVPLGVGVFVAGIIFFMQNHLSAAVLVMTTLLIQMFIAGINFKALITAIIAGGITGYFAVTSIFKKASRTDLDRQE